MKLTLSQIKEITTGAVNIKELDGGVHFYRFTDAQMELYRERSSDFYMKTHGTSGVVMRFLTDSESLSLTVDVIGGGSSRSYFSVEVFVDGRRLGALSNFRESELPLEYPKVKLPLGTHSGDFALGSGEKEVRIYFPWSVEAVLKELSLDDGAYIKPKLPIRKIIFFGDSITHGYDALYPSGKYTTRLSDALGAAEYNKAIGAEIFFPALAGEADDFTPDYIFVAYGTNDWTNCDKDTFLENCKSFFTNLRSTYPNTKIFAITPIWRKGVNATKPIGTLSDLDRLIRELTADIGGISVITGFGFVPADPSLFADQKLHPNDAGFGYYYSALEGEVKGILGE